MPFTLKTINAFEMLHRAAACEIEAERPDHRAFVCVYPPRRPRSHYEWAVLKVRYDQWTVKRFEIPKALVHGDPYDGDLVDLEFVHLNSLDEVEQLLARWGVDSSKFDATWKSDYPV